MVGFFNFFSQINVRASFILLLAVMPQIGMAAQDDSDPILNAAKRAIALEHLKEIKPLLVRSVETGNVEAKELLALYYLCDLDIPCPAGDERDYVSALPLLKVAAEAGRVKAMNWLTTFYLQGRVVSKDEKLAQMWGDKASLLQISQEPSKREEAERGDLTSQLWLGEYFENSHYYNVHRDTAGNWQFSGIGSDSVLAMQWYEKAAEHGSLEAIRAMNRLLSTGTLGSSVKNGALQRTGIPKDEAAAFSWAMKGAELGDPLMQHQVGVAYAFGEGVERDGPKALHWFEQAASKDYTVAQAWLGKAYADGNLVGQDFDKARIWLEKAASHGDLRSAKRLSSLANEAEEAEKRAAEDLKYKRLCSTPDAESHFGEVARDRLTSILSRIPDCKQAAERYHTCLWGSSADIDFGAIVINSCEKSFIDKLSPAGLETYQLEHSLCGKMYAEQSGTMYISAAMTCSVDLAARYAHSRELWSKSTPRASFDCAVAVTPIEKAICENSELGKDDIVLSRVFHSSMSDVAKADKPRLIQTQKAWMEAVVQMCKPGSENKNMAVECLEKQFRYRTARIVGCIDGDDAANCLAIDDLNDYLANKSPD